VALVSCIMPTRNRPLFAGQAISYFLRQDYPQRELIILDDGDEPIADLIPCDERIRYVRLSRRQSVGAKRNLACEASRGEWIVHWDDDDWMAANRLSLQVSRVLKDGAHVCGTTDVLYYRPDAGQAWLYRYPVEARPWLAGCTLVYRRSVWERHRFAEIDAGEDTKFVWDIAGSRFSRMADSSFYVGLIHPGNTSGKNVAGPRWERRPLEEVTNRIASDRAFYATLRHGAVAARERRASPQAINVGAHYDVSTGYGSMAEYLVRGMARAGAAVQVIPLSLHPEGLSQEFHELVRRSRPDRDAPALYFSWPQPELEGFWSYPDLFINTMWETSRLPVGWAEKLNRSRAVIVPTRWVAGMLRENGVTVPIEVVPEGIDPEVYRLTDRPESDCITTLMVGPIDNRKHAQVGIAAWKEAFAGDPNARLIIKSQYGYLNYTPDDPRIHYVDSVERTRGIAHWYRQADVLLALGNEGFGLPLVEAMATGLPVIAMNSEGQSDVCDEAAECLLPVKPGSWERYRHDRFGDCGVRGAPRVADVRDRLKWVASHREEARQLGRAASEWALRHRNVWTKGPAVLEVIERYGSCRRALRRTTEIWIPSWRSRCGVAEYTASLVEALPPHVHVTAEAPDAKRVRLLHIQHEASLFQGRQLTASIAQASQAGASVVVTEHAVSQQPRDWEQSANAIVTLNSRGAARLCTRWPQKRIAYIPIGCPTWFPPRKAARGKVIGAFGFLGRHKGFWQLLDTVRAIPGAEMVLYSHAKSALASAWEEAAKGLPVRRVADYLPAKEIGRRLAAEADVLVFWYSETSTISASAAIRIGLATGVPVLASPTAWFHDLREVTYQAANPTEGLRRLLDDTELRERLAAAAETYCRENSWARAAERHLALWRELMESS
jgi:glycosyltransferase involved in cell wall biosynthesis